MKIIAIIRKTINQIISPVYFDLKEEYCELFYKRDLIENRNVLIGTLRSFEQLSINLQHNFYHIPLNVIGSADGIEYVALYQSKNLFSNTHSGTGVHYIGKVINSTIVKRGEISEIATSYNFERLYVKFNVSEWKHLDVPKKVGSTFPKVYLKTSLFLFENALSINEVKFDTVEKHVLYLGINEIISETFDGFCLNSIKARRIANFLFFKSYKGHRITTIKNFFSKSDEILEEIYALL